MAYELQSEKYYAAWYPYKGEYEIAVSDITFDLPDQLLPEGWISKIHALFVDKFKEYGETMLYMKTEVDKSATWQTRFRVTTYSHPGVLIVLGVIAALIALVLLASMVWNISTAIKTISENPVLSWGFLLIAIAAVAVVGAVIYYLYKTGKFA